MLDQLPRARRHGVVAAKTLAKIQHLRDHHLRRAVGGAVKLKAPLPLRSAAGAALVRFVRIVFEADAERGWPQLKVLEYSDAATVNAPIDNFLNCMETVSPLYQTEFDGRGVGAQFGLDPDHPGRMKMIAGDLDGFYFYDGGSFRYVPQQTLMLLPKERPLRIQLDWNAMRSKVAHKVDWQYPRDAARQHIGGKVVVHVVLDAAGKIKEITPAEGPPILSDPVLQAVKQWTFEPTTLDGDPVEVELNVEAIFTIN